MQNFSLLDLSPIPEGHTAADALANSVALAQMAEGAGYHRYCLPNITICPASPVLRRRW